MLLELHYVLTLPAREEVEKGNIIMPYICHPKTMALP